MPRLSGGLSTFAMAGAGEGDRTLDTQLGKAEVVMFVY